jgi:ABC-type transport system substrate-binding protein
MALSALGSGVEVFQYFFSAGAYVGQIYTTGSATVYASASDYRLKENVVTDWDATTRLKQLKPSRFNFIKDSETTLDGFLAHEVQDIVPEAIIGEKDGLKADGTPKYQGIDQSKLVPLLTKALQEQQTLIESLEARITALES